MKALRGPRALALALAGALGLAVAVLGLTAPAAAVGEPAVIGSVEDTNGNSMGLVPIEIRDADDNSLITTANSTLIGTFAIADVPDGDIVVIARPGGTSVDAFAILSADSDPTSRDAGTLVVDTDGVALSGTVTNAATNAPLQGILVVALGSDPAHTVPDWDGTDIAGAYQLNVPRDETYLLAAQEASATPTFMPAYWDAPPTDPCGCGDEIVVSLTGVVNPAGPFDFALASIDDTIWFSVYGMTWDGNDYTGVTITLEKLVSGVWTSVDSSDTDSGGFVDLYGLGAGDYRMSFALGGTALTVTSAEEPACGCGGGGIVYPLDNGGLNALFSGITAASPGTGPQYLEVDLTFAQPASSGGGGSTPGAPATPRGGRISAPFTLTSTVTPTPTPTPTSTPTPSSSPSSSPSPTPSATPEPAPGDPGFPWWIILIIVIAIGIVILVVVLVRRR